MADARSDSRSYASIDLEELGRLLNEPEVDLLIEIAKTAATYVVLRERGRGGEKMLYQRLRQLIGDVEPHVETREKRLVNLRKAMHLPGGSPDVLKGNQA